MEQSGQKLIEIERNASEKIILEEIIYKGEKSLDLRLWCVNEFGDCLPTRKGIILTPEQFQKLTAGEKTTARTYSHPLIKACEEFASACKAVEDDDCIALNVGVHDGILRKAWKKLKSEAKKLRFCELEPQTKKRR